MRESRKSSQPQTFPSWNTIFDCATKGARPCHLQQAYCPSVQDSTPSMPLSFRTKLSKPTLDKQPYCPTIHITPPPHCVSQETPQNKSKMPPKIPWPNTNPRRGGSLAIEVQLSIPLSLYNFYDKRSRDKMPAKAYSEWIETEELKEHQRKIMRAKVKCEFREVEWDEGFWPREARGRCGCAGCRMKWVRKQRGRRERGRGRGRKGRR